MEEKPLNSPRFNFFLTQFVVLSTGNCVVRNYHMIFFPFLDLKNGLMLLFTAFSSITLCHSYSFMRKKCAHPRIYACCKDAHAWEFSLLFLCTSIFRNPVLLSSIIFSRHGRGCRALIIIRSLSSIFTLPAAVPTVPPPPNLGRFR